MSGGLLGTFPPSRQNPVTHAGFTKNDEKRCETMRVVSQVRRPDEAEGVGE
jgi:hypothetical protein